MTVFSPGAAARRPPLRSIAAEMRLYSHSGRRLYLNDMERQRFRVTALRRPPDQAALCLLLLYTGCRISEALSVRAEDVQTCPPIIGLRTLKRRRPGVVREVPVPEELGLRLRALSATADNAPILPWHRSTAWRIVKEVMREAGITGAHAMPKGLRHGFGVNAVRCGVPLNLLARWMGHASMATTAIYADATGPEERDIAAKAWRTLVRNGELAVT